MQYDHLQLTIHSGVARLTLNRPDKLNSFTVAMHQEMQAALAAVVANPSVRVLVLTGAGRGFCAGQDLGDRAVAPGAEPPDLGHSIDRYYGPLVRQLRTFPLPVVCAVNGVAAGAGANIALACDIVVAVDSASFIQPFSRLGLVPDAGGTWFLPQSLGRARALGLALLGDSLSAPQAAQWGLIWRCVAAADFASEVDALAHRLATGPTLGLVRTRQAIDAAVNSSLDEQLDRERDFQRELGHSHDYAEGVAAFMGKRTPQFTGR